jgi:hypothetical protein
MSPRAPAGSTLVELLVALSLLASLAILSAPLAARNALLLHQGRLFLDGTEVSAARAARIRSSVGPPCTATAGRDTGNLAVVEWTTAPAPDGLSFLAVIQDRSGRFPAESLATVIPCLP